MIAKKDLIDTLLKFLIYVLVVIAILLVLSKIFGRSATTADIALVIVLTMIVELFRLEGRLGRIEGELAGIKGKKENI